MTAYVWQKVFLITVICILSYQLLVSPIIGIANNGDFERIMNWGGILYQTHNYADRYFDFINSTFDIKKGVSDGTVFYASSQVLILKVALAFNELFSKDSMFHIISLGIVHLLLHALALYLIVRASIKRGKAAVIIASVILIMIYTSSGYVSYFNSFYSEPSSLIFLLMSVGIVLNIDKDKPNIWAMIALAFSLMMVIGSKVHNSLIGIPLAMYGFRIAWHYKEKLTRYVIIILTTIFLIVSVGFFQKGTPKEYREWNIYHGIFMGILWDSPNRGKDLQDLGLNPDYAKYARIDVFQKDTPFNNESFRNDILSKVSSFSIAKFYMFHPKSLYWVLDYASKKSFIVKIDYLGNFEKSSGVKAVSQSKAFSLWDKIRGHLPKNIWFIIGFYLLFCGVILRKYLKKKSILLELVFMLPFLSLILFSTVMMGDGIREAEKHLFLFNAMFDLCVAISLFWVFHSLIIIVIRKRWFRNSI